MAPVQTRSGATSGQAAVEASKHALDSAHGSSPKKYSKMTGKDTSHSKPASSTQTEKKNKARNAAPEVVEAGIINYFIRGRVEIEEPKAVEEIARGYLVMRPVPKDAHLAKRPLALTARLLALPKKVLPQSTSDCFMVFVDETHMPYLKLADGLLAPREYATKTKGTRHVPGATPVGEGVYAIIQSESETHLAYISSLPEQKSASQSELGFQDRGSFIISTKNPKFAGPAYAQLPSPPEYTQKLLDEFGSYYWIPTKPEHLDYKNTQVLMIGHGRNHHLTAGDEKVQAEVESKLEALEEEDIRGMRHLSSDESESIFLDLQARSMWYHDILGTLEHNKAK